MNELYGEKGRLQLRLSWVWAGGDLVVVLSGGNKPHIGCVLLGVPRPSLRDASQVSSTISVLNCTGHKDEAACRPLLHRLVCELQQTVSLTCGIHLDDITAQELEDVKILSEQLTDSLLAQLKKAG